MICRCMDLLKLLGKDAQIVNLTTLSQMEVTRKYCSTVDRSKGFSQRENVGNRGNV